VSRLLVVVVALLVAAPASAQPATMDIRTRAEITDFAETSTAAEVTRVIDALRAASPLVRVQSFGTTEEGRDMPLLVLSDPAVETPEAAHALARPVVFVMANIHAGEVEGKEASLILARRLLTGDLKAMLTQVVVLIAPNYNADGNEQIDVQHRTAQNGPVGGVGTRENAKKLDLNRDFMKLPRAPRRARSSRCCTAGIRTWRWTCTPPTGRTTATT
jgi:murein tripeptide amidase MpaA